MNERNLAAVMCAASLGALGVAPAALAQEDDSVFETVIVTAQKREQSIYDVPVAISAFTPETIEKQGITDLTDIGKFVPNLNITGFSAGHTSSAESVHPRHRPAGSPDHDRAGRRRLRRWRLSRPPGRPELEPREYRARRSAARPAGHAVRAQFDRRRHQHHHAQARRRTRRQGLVDGRHARPAEWRLRTRTCRCRTSSRMSLQRAFQRRDGLGDFLLIEDPSKEVGEMEDISGRIAHASGRRPTTCRSC